MASHRNTTNFVRDFFFSDIDNHVEFLKWTQTLDKEDDVLLVYILERLARADPPLPLKKFYGSIGDDEENGDDENEKHSRSNKNPLNIAKGYALMQGLDGHDYNMFEFAYLSRREDSWSTQCIAYMAALIQVSFLVVLVMYNFFETSVIITPGEDFFGEVVAVMIVSSALFGATLRQQFHSCQTFVSTMTQLALPSYRDIFLILDRIINQILGVAIFFFNFYFILVSDTPTEAVMNSVALGFIVEIDDQFKLNWDDDTIEDAIAFLLRDYIMEPLDSDDLIVVRHGPTVQTDDKFYVQITSDIPPQQQQQHFPFSHKDDEEPFFFSVIIHSAMNRDQSVNLARSYASTRFDVSGPKAIELWDAFHSFHSPQNYLDFHH